MPDPCSTQVEHSTRLSPPSPTMFKVDLQPIGRRVEVEAGATLLSAAQTGAVGVIAICGGMGICGSCRVRPITGKLSPPTVEEKYELGAEGLENGLRLACQASALSDVVVDIPPGSLTTPQRLQLEGRGLQVVLDPVILPIDIHLDPPGLEDLRSDAQRLMDSLADQVSESPSYNLAALAEISSRLHSQNWQGRAVIRRMMRPMMGGNALITVVPPASPLLGFAIDIGTTKLAGYLIDLQTGSMLAKGGAANPQIAFGEDVVSRIAYTNQQPENRYLLQRRLIETLNRLVQDLCAEAGVAPHQIVECVAAGNTAMHHLFLGLPVTSLGEAPYVPVVSTPLEVPARDLGLQLNPGTFVYLPGNIAGFVGADHVAVLLETGVMDTAR
ncbi:MAG: 2Fe-2S iron-sulfur cluster binding domain-containing protein, partial [Chloroflexi bacterium]|nr:2Fe-2S iron-sulfur cluster binding domain-containing protein [Chloroflexota bacterium]